MVRAGSVTQHAAANRGISARHPATHDTGRAMRLIEPDEFKDLWSKRLLGDAMKQETQGAMNAAELIRYSDDDLTVIQQDWDALDPTQLVAMNLAREVQQLRAALEARAGAAVAWLYENSHDGESDHYLSRSRFLPSWVAAKGATETPLYLHPAPPEPGEAREVSATSLAPTGPTIREVIDASKREADVLRLQLSAVVALAEGWNADARAEGFGGGAVKGREVLDAISDAAMRAQQEGTK